MTSLTSPFRSRFPSSARSTTSSKSPRTPNRLPPGETPCSRHPRSWVEKKVFFLTKTRECPYCELESYAVDPDNPDAPLPPCEPGFGGFAPTEPKRRRNPRAAGQRRAPTPRSGGRGTPSGGIPRGTPHQRSSTPRTATIVRRTAVFNANGGVPKKDPQGAAKMPRRAAKTPSPSRARRNPRTPRRHSFSASSAISTLTPTLNQKKPGDDSSALHTPSSKPPVGATTPIRQGKSLMFTSIARRRAKEGRTPTPKSCSTLSTAAGNSASSPGNSGGRARGGVFRPPSPSGSVFSDRSGAGSSHTLRRRGSESVVLDLPEAVDKEGGDSGGGRDKVGREGEQGVTLSPISMARGNLPAPSSHAGDATASVVRLMEIDRGNGVARTPVSRLLSMQTSGGCSMPYLEAVISPGVSERAEAAVEVASERIRPLTTIVSELSDAMLALRPQVLVDMARGGIDEILRAAGVAIRRARVLTKDEGMFAGGEGDDYEEQMGDVDEEELEAAGAILVEASDAVEAMVQTARALVWSGKEPRNIGASPAFVERHETAEVSLGEAARRAKLLLGRLIATGETPGGRRVVPDAAAAAAAAVEREWFAVVDRHENWMGRRDSRKGLLVVEQEIPSEAVTVFRDCPLLPEGSLGRTYLAEYLGEPVAATILEYREESGNAAFLAGDRLATSLSAIAASELRAIASLLPAHPRLARTHGSKVIPPQGFHSLSGGGRGGDGAAGAGESDNRVFLFLIGELVEGGCLHDRVAASASEGCGDYGGDRRQEGKGFRRRQVLADVAEGLAFLHDRGLTHGALSSKNVLLDAGGRAKLSLFGLIETRRAVATMVDASIGRPNGFGHNVWTAPEALTVVDIAGGDAAGGDQGMAVGLREREREAGMAADAYAFGMIAWEVLTGERPWAGMTADEVSSRVCRGERPPLPSDPVTIDGFGDMLQMLWAQDPRARPPLGEVATRLRVHDIQQPEPLGLSLRNVAAGTDVYTSPGRRDIDFGGSFEELEGGRDCEGDGVGNRYGYAPEGLGNPVGVEGASTDHGGNGRGLVDTTAVVGNAGPSSSPGGDDGVHELEAERVLEESATAAAAAVAIARDNMTSRGMSDHQVTRDEAEPESTAGEGVLLEEAQVIETEKESRRCSSRDVEDFIISSGSSSSSSTSSSSGNTNREAGGRDTVEARDSRTPTISRSTIAVATARPPQGRVSWAEEVCEEVGGDVTPQAFYRPARAGAAEVLGTPLLSSSPLLSTDTTPRAGESEEDEEEQKDEITASEPLSESIDDMPALVSMSTIMSLSDEEEDDEDYRKEENASPEETPTEAAARVLVLQEEAEVIQRSTSSGVLVTTEKDGKGSAEAESREKSQASSRSQQATNKADRPNQQQQPPLLPLFSLDLSQISDYSKASATVVVTPPTGVLNVAEAAKPSVEMEPASPVQHEKGAYAVSFASSQLKQVDIDEVDVASPGVARASSASSTPGRRGRAGAALRGIASSLAARLAKKKKGSGSAGR